MLNVKIHCGSVGLVTSIILALLSSPLSAGQSDRPAPGIKTADLSQPRQPSGRLEPCGDRDGDGFISTDCGGDDCDDTDAAIHPGAIDWCGDGIDQNCSGADLNCATDHGELDWRGPGTCVACHDDEAADVHASVMYQWQGDAPLMTNGGPRQGKDRGGVNSYCIHILGNWAGCGSCHIGLGALPSEDPNLDQLKNIDCLLCNQDRPSAVSLQLSSVPRQGGRRRCGQTR